MCIINQQSSFCVSTGSGDKRTVMQMNVCDTASQENTLPFVLTMSRLFTFSQGVPEQILLCYIYINIDCTLDEESTFC